MIQNKLMAPLKRIILPMLVCGLVFLSACSKLSCQSSPSVAPTAVVKKMQRADAEIPLALLAPDGLGVRLHLTKPLFVSSPALKSLQDFLTTVLPDFDFAKIAALPVKEVIIGLESDGQKFFVIGRADANFKRTPAEVTDFAKANGLAVTTETRADLTYYYFDDDHLQTLVNLTQDFFVFGDEALILKVRDRHTQAVEAAVLPASDPAIPARFVWRRGGDYPDLRIEVTDAPTPKLIVTAMFTNPLLKTAADAAIAIFVQTHQDFGEAWQRGKDDSNFTTLRRSWELNVIPYDRLTALVSQYYEETMQLLFN